MGSLEEEQLVQMVYDFIESESPSSTSSSSSENQPLHHQSAYLTLQELLGTVKDSEFHILEKVLKYLRNITAGKVANLNKWIVMRLRMDGYDASLCKTSWATTCNCPGGDYEYIDIVMEDENGGPLRLIIDIDFKSQFELARPTPTYAQLSDILPSIFVGSEDKLNEIISLLCTAAKQSLKESGLHIPPWRTTSYMQSKWLSECQKVPITPFMTFSRDFDRTNKEGNNSGHSSNSSKWAPPIVKPKSKDLGSGSGLSSQFSKMSIDCC
ncbi:PREDICTED: uncharacterized protein LOC104589254 [Nelumbo nucifera]|uniref:Uncharacterized protein n=2 Tax=Nelumbo nucifera TaxID=4432 RepID=A0A822Z5T9_NELNU|nr:PREDICTED: uncharacterized protein LOC104589254 [Nelumbo nucifera]DAD39960.1 TPA_asm: hypothetical protein HUJ06_014283 [Nelumbo nucifera]